MTRSSNGFGYDEAAQPAPAGEGWLPTPRRSSSNAETPQRRPLFAGRRPRGPTRTPQRSQVIRTSLTSEAKLAPMCLEQLRDMRLNDPGDLHRGPVASITTSSRPRRELRTETRAQALRWVRREDQRAPRTRIMDARGCHHGTVAPRTQSYSYSPNIRTTRP